MGRFARLRGRGRAAIAAGLVVALVLAFTGVSAVLLPSRAFAAESTLTVLVGSVEVQTPGGAFAAAADGAILVPGSTLRTGKDTSAVVTFFDGSTVTLEADSELTLETVSGNGRGDVVISLFQKIGSSWHVVAHKLTPDSSYKVRTPSATASVRGTAFETNVTAEGSSEFITNEGVVAAQAKGAEVPVGPGQKTDVPVDAAPKPAEPAPQLPVVQVVVPPTQNAAVVDGKGRAAGVVGGNTVRYTPRSSVTTNADGNIVVSIQTKDPQRFSTIVKSENASTPVAIETQVLVGGQVAAKMQEARAPDASGTSRGGVVVTTAGLVGLPDAIAQQFTLPNVAKIPDFAAAAGGFPGLTGNVAKPDQLLGGTTPQIGGGAGGGTAQSIPGFDATTGKFNGGFQAFQTPGAGGGQATTLTFTPEQAQQLQSLLPGAPPGAKDATRAAGFGAGSPTSPVFQTAPTSPIGPTGAQTGPTGAFQTGPTGVQTGPTGVQTGPTGGTTTGPTPPTGGQGTFPGQGQQTFPGQVPNTFPGIGQGTFPGQGAFNPFAGSGAATTTGGAGAGGGGGGGGCQNTAFGVTCQSAGQQAPFTPSTFPTPTAGGPTGPTPTTPLSGTTSPTDPTAGIPTAPTAGTPPTGGPTAGIPPTAPTAGTPPQTITGPTTPPQTITGPTTPPQTITGPTTPPQTITGPTTPPQTITGPTTPPQTITGPTTPPTGPRPPTTTTTTPTAPLPPTAPTTTTPTAPRPPTTTTTTPTAPLPPTAPQPPTAPTTTTPTAPLPPTAPQPPTTITGPITGPTITTGPITGPTTTGPITTGPITGPITTGPITTGPITTGPITTGPEPVTITGPTGGFTAPEPITITGPTGGFTPPELPPPPTAP